VYRSSEKDICCFFLHSSQKDYLVWKTKKKQKNKTSNVLFLITVHILNDVGISG